MKAVLTFILLLLMAPQAIATDGLLLDLIVPPGEKDRFPHAEMQESSSAFHSC